MNMACVKKAIGTLRGMTEEIRMREQLLSKETDPKKVSYVLTALENELEAVNEVATAFELKMKSKPRRVVAAIGRRHPR